jgi:hypothetical protein
MTDRTPLPEQLDVIERMLAREGGKGLARHPSAQGHGRLDPLDYGKR